MRQSNLQPHPGRFIGRLEEQEALVRLLRAHHLVTLKGPGGAGKTRLSCQFGEQMLNHQPPSGGVWFCDLTGAKSQADILQAVAGPLGVNLGEKDGIRDIGRALEQRGQTLIILDNFEQIVAHAEDTIGAWLAAAPEAQFLVSSRERLRLPGEQVLELGPLAMVDAIDLFTDRAHAAKDSFDPEGADSEHLEQICTQLDCLPLALELAASRITSMSLADISSRLDDRFKLLRRGSRGASPRQATLEGAIGWSWDLLLAWEKAALCQLTAFRGGFFMESAEALLDLHAHDDAPWAIFAIESLLDKSLIFSQQPDTQPARTRFGMLESIRFFVEAQMDPATQQAVWLRHAQHTVDALLPPHLDLSTNLPEPDISLLAMEGENLDAVIERFASTQPELTARAITSLFPLIFHGRPVGDYIATLSGVVDATGPLEPETELRLQFLLGCAQASVDPSEAQRIFQALVTQATAHGAHGMRGIALSRTGRVLTHLGDFDAAEDHLMEALDCLRAHGHHVWEGDALQALGLLFDESGEMERAHDHYQQCIELNEELGELRHLGIIKGEFGNFHRKMGRHKEAEACFREGVALAEQVGDHTGAANQLSNLAILHAEQGHLEQAEGMFRRSLDVFRTTGEDRRVGVTMGNLGFIVMKLGRPLEAEDLYLQALAIHKRTRNTSHIGMVLGNIGIMRWEQGKLDEAEAHFQESVGILGSHGMRRIAGYFQSFLGGLIARLDRVDEAETLLKEAVVNLEFVGDPIGLALVELHRGQVDLALSRAARLSGDTDAARAHRAAARTRLEEVESPIPPSAEHPEGQPSATSQCEDARIAANLLRRTLSPFG